MNNQVCTTRRRRVTLASGTTCPQAMRTPLRRLHESAILREVTILTAPILEVPEHFRPLRREEFMQLADLGVFGEERVELVGGVLILMSPQKPPHAGVVIMLNEMLVLQVHDRYAIACQAPIELDEVSQPLPDLMVLPRGDYRSDNPADALLIIEVADSSLHFDLSEKARRYAMAGTPLYWVVDVTDKVVHVHTGPHDDGSWESIRQEREGELTAEDLDLTIDLEDLLNF